MAPSLSFCFYKIRTNRINLTDKMMPSTKKGPTSTSMTKTMTVVMTTMEGRRGEENSTY